MRRNMVYYEERCSLRIFQQLLSLFVVLVLDLLIIQESLLLADMLVNLEAVLVEGEAVFPTGNILDADWSGIPWTVQKRLWAIHICRLRWGAILVGLKVMQNSINIVWRDGGSFRNTGKSGGRCHGKLYVDCCHDEVV